MRTLIHLLLFALITIVFISETKAQSKKVTNAGKVKTTQIGPRFTDNNADGICDHFTAAGQHGGGGNFTDKNNNGICDNRESERVQGQGPNFTDANNDGICDHRQNGTGKGFRHRNNRGTGSNSPSK